jgi:hypothetical protein
MSDMKLYSYERIKRISWDIQWPCPPSHDLLIKQYLQRSAYWAKYLEQESEWPFWNIAESLIPTYVSPSAEKIQELFADKTRFEHAAAEVKEFTGKREFPFIVQQTCIWYGVWSDVCSFKDVKSINLPDPFEPLIRYYERGGMILWLEPTRFGTTRSLFVKIDVYSWMERLLPVHNLSDAELDEIDKGYLDD